MADLPCNCDQALELTKTLEGLVKDIEESVHEKHHFTLRDKARAAREVLKKYEEAAFEASRCQHCGLPGGH